MDIDYRVFVSRVEGIEVEEGKKGEELEKFIERGGFMSLMLTDIFFLGRGVRKVFSE